MKLLGVSGSTLKGGNNEKMIDFVLGIAKKRGFKTDKLFLSEYKIAPCCACNKCKKEDSCSQKDNMEKAREKLLEADAVIVSSPVYFGSVSAQLKALFDRTIRLRRNGFALKNKIGAAIAVGRTRNGGQELTLQAIHAFMHIHGMIVVGDNSHFGGTVQHPFEEDGFGKKTVEDTANKVCDTLEMLKP